MTREYEPPSEASEPPAPGKDAHPSLAALFISSRFCYRLFLMSFGLFLGDVSPPSSMTISSRDTPPLS